MLRSTTGSPGAGGWAPGRVADLLLRPGPQSIIHRLDRPEGSADCPGRQGPTDKAAATVAQHHPPRGLKYQIYNLKGLYTRFSRSGSFREFLMGPGGAKKSRETVPVSILSVKLF